MISNYSLINYFRTRNNKIIIIIIDKFAAILCKIGWRNFPNTHPTSYKKSFNGTVKNFQSACVVVVVVIVKMSLEYFSDLDGILPEFDTMYTYTWRQIYCKQKLYLQRVGESPEIPTIKLGIIRSLLWIFFDFQFRIMLSKEILCGGDML